MAQNWDKAVELQLHGNGGYRIVRSTEDAAICLLERWPRGSGRAFFRAQEACLDGLDGKLSAARVREAFISAAEEAEIPIRTSQDQKRRTADARPQGKAKVSFAEGAWRKAGGHR